jgi:hypothetical protein
MSVTSLPASAVSREELNSILSDYLAFDRARVFRQLLVTRLGLLAGAIALAGLLFDRLSHRGWWIALCLCVAPAAWARIVERRLQHRFARRLEGVPGVSRFRRERTVTERRS